MPDIIISERDGLRDALAVEVKSSALEQPAAERRLKRYMVGMSCPLGLIVTPERLWLYRDTFRSRREDAIELIAELSADGLFGPGVVASARANTAAMRGVGLEDIVQAWLEGLRSPSATSSLPPDLRNALEEYVVPAVLEGSVGAAAPRFQRTGS
jgi:hypothetical protein